MFPVLSNPNHAAPGASTPCLRKKAQASDDTASQCCQLARDVAGAMLAVPVTEIADAARSRQAVCEARHVGMYIAHIVFQLPFQAVAEGFQRHRSTVSYAVRQVEERRDDGGFDALLTQHEQRAAALRSKMQRARP